MKIKHLLIGLFAVAATVACKQDEPVETPSLEVSQESLELTATEAEASFDVTSNVAWTATADQDWVSLDPTSGDASESAVTVTVTAENNTANEARTATVTVTAGEKVLVPFATTPVNATSTVTASSSATTYATAQIVGRKVEITGEEAGSATITITANGHTDTIAVTVQAAA